MVPVRTEDMERNREFFIRKIKEKISKLNSRFKSSTLRFPVSLLLKNFWNGLFLGLRADSNLEIFSIADIRGPIQERIPFHSFRLYYNKFICFCQYDNSPPKNSGFYLFTTCDVIHFVHFVLIRLKRINKNCPDRGRSNFYLQSKYLCKRFYYCAE